MSDLKDPTRLLEAGSEASDQLRRLFSHAARDLPSPSDLARLEMKLGPMLDAPPGAPLATGTSPLGKVALGLVGSGIVAAGLWLATRSEPPQSEPPKPTAPIAAPPAPSPPAEGRSATPAEPATIAPAPAASPRSEAGPSPAKRPSGIPEDQLLEQARSALRTNPDRALSLARQHQVEFPRGALSQEREVIAIEALRRLGRTEEAARRTERFERLYPKSPHQRKLDAPQRER